jgi:transcriptional regulator with XRE-family HTH domain
MSFQIDLSPFEVAYAHFSRKVREAIQRTFEQEEASGLTQKELAETLGVDEALVSRRLNGPGNITLKTLCDLYTAMGREPLENFMMPIRELTTPSTNGFYTLDGPKKNNVDHIMISSMAA